MGKIQLEDSELGSFFNVLWERFNWKILNLEVFHHVLWERFNWKILNLEVFSMVYGKDSTGRF